MIYSFLEYCQQQEAAAAFGNISTMNRDFRVQTGMRVEDKIKSALWKGYGIKIQKPTIQQDMYDKIDGFLPTGEPIQIKYRQTGPDILYELIKPHLRNEPLDAQRKGRDYIGQAKYYFTLSQDGNTIYKIPTSHIKVLMQQVIKELNGQPLTTPFTSRTGVQLRPVNDPSDGTAKVNAFIPPSVFTGISQIYQVNMAA